MYYDLCAHMASSLCSTQWYKQVSGNSSYTLTHARDSIGLFISITLFHVIFPNVPHIQSKCGAYLGILCEIMSGPHNNCYGFE